MLVRWVYSRGLSTSATQSPRVGMLTALWRHAWEDRHRPVRCRNTLGQLIHHALEPAPRALRTSEWTSIVHSIVRHVAETGPQPAGGGADLLLDHAVNTHADGKALVVKLRAELRRLQRQVARDRGQIELDGWDSQAAERLDSVLRNVLSHVYSRSTLDVVEVTWEHSSGKMLEQIAASERVHPTDRMWRFQQRFGKGRRCFALVHPKHCNEPLAFVHVALTPDVAPSLAYINRFSGVKASNGVLSALPVAMFWSVGNCVPGLDGLYLARNLLYSVVDGMRGEARRFCTLSPLPQFAPWARRHLVENGQQDWCDLFTAWQRFAVARGGQQLLAEERAAGIGGPIQSLASGFPSRAPPLHDHEAESGGDAAWSAESERQLAPFMLRLAARYLVREGWIRGQEEGESLCPVAQFHCSNGAILHQLRWAANIAPKGIAESGGIMANYEYDPEHTAVRAEIMEQGVDSLPRDSHVSKNYSVQ